MSLLLPESGLIFWMLLSFGVVFVVLAKYGFPIITRMVDERKAYIDRSLDEAREANRQLSTVRQQGEQLMAEAGREQARILREAMQERDRIVAEARQQAGEVARKELEEARELIRQEKETAIRDIRKELAVLSVGIAEKIIRERLDNETEQMAMIDRMLDEVVSRQLVN